VNVSEEKCKLQPKDYQGMSLLFELFDQHFLHKMEQMSTNRLANKYKEDFKWACGKKDFWQVVGFRI